MKIREARATERKMKILILEALIAGIIILVVSIGGWVVDFPPLNPSLNLEHAPYVIGIGITSGVLLLAVISFMVVVWND